MRNRIYTIIFAGLLTSGCASWNPFKKAASNQDEVVSAQDSSPLPEPANTTVSWGDCLKYTFPDGVISAGLIFITPEPVSFLVGAAYYSSTFYRCKAMTDPNIAVNEAKLQQLSNDIKDASRAYFESSKNALSDMITSASTHERRQLREDFESVSNRLRALTDLEVERLQKISGKTLLEFYEQIDAIKAGQFETVRQIESNERVPVKPVPVTE